ncbi:TPA: type VI secretion system Vgr family protein [Enterobacter asburiae]
MFDRITATTPAGDGTLQFWKLEGMEVVSRSFELTVTLLSTDARLDRRAMLGQPITLTIPTSALNAAPRYLNGKITSVKVHSADLNGTRYAVYTLVMESDLWPLKRDRNQRIFQNQRLPDIIKTVLGEYGVNVEDRLAGDYRTWEYCVQYQESSYDFISRLMELEGIYFFFRHDAEQHTLVMFDAPQQHKPFSGYETIPYHATASGGSTDEEGIGAWSIAEQVTPGIYSLDDYDFRKPNAWMFHARQNPSSPQPGKIDYYEWPGRFVEHSHGEFYARIRQEEWQAEHQRIDAKATSTGIVPGCTFTLTQPPFASDADDYLILSALYHFEENTYASGGGESNHTVWLTVIPSATQFRSAQRTAWPRTHGPQTAKVVGPQGESIWTDKYGRVKVKFHWDRHAKGDDTSSCWVRVSSAWAGQGFGGVQIPRVNDEVVIDFINGDPDRPMVTGRVYNESSMPPWALPAAATQMGFMTRSKDGTKDNASYLFFEDKLGSEKLDMHAEKDMKISVENDMVVTVHGNRITEIKKEQKDAVTGNATFDYKAQRTTTVDKLETKIFKEGEKTSITNGRVLDITSGGDKITVKGDKTTIVDGNEEHHVTSKITENYDGGQDTTIASGGMKVNVNGGNWEQNVNDGTIHIYSPNEIKLTSGTSITMEAPAAEFKPKLHSLTVTAFNESVTGHNLSVTGLSEIVTVNNVSFSGISSSLGIMSNSANLATSSIKVKDWSKTLFKAEINSVNVTREGVKIFNSVANVINCSLHIIT